MLRFLSPTWHELQKLKKGEFSAPYVEDNPEGYRIKIIGRGEQLFYQQDDKALFVEIVTDSKNNCENIFAASIKKWDNGKKVTEDEKRLILTRLKNYFVNIQKMKSIFVDKNGEEFTLE
jgi:hypothetical protein